MINFKLKIAVITLAFFPVISVCFAETVKFNIPALLGPIRDEKSLTAVFDTNTPPDSIGQIRLRLKGSFRTGIAKFVGEANPDFFTWSGRINAVIQSPDSYFWWQASTPTFETDSHFDIETPFLWTSYRLVKGSAPTWSFLSAQKNPIKLAVCLKDYQSPSLLVIKPRAADIELASLIIEGPIRLISPNGSNALKAGQTFSIKYQDFREDKTTCHKYNLKFSSDNGRSWLAIDFNISDPCSYNWHIPFVDSNNCLIRIIDAIDPNIRDTSDNTFSIRK